MRTSWILLVTATACGGKIAPLDDDLPARAAADAGAPTTPADTPPSQQVGPLGPTPPPTLSTPAECTHREASTSIIATTCSASDDCSTDQPAQRVSHCPCGDYRLRLHRSGCIEAAESWTKGVGCVAEALLGQRFCSVDGDGTSSETCVSLTIPCVR